MEPAAKRRTNRASPNATRISTTARGTTPNLLTPFANWYREALPNGYYLYQEALASAPTTHVRVRNGKTKKESQDLQPGLVQLPRDLLPARGKKAATEAIQAYGLGASAPRSSLAPSRSTRGSPRSSRRSRDKEACIIFPTGYSANVGLDLHPHAGDTIFLDQTPTPPSSTGRSWPVQDLVSSAQQPNGPRAEDGSDHGQEAGRGRGCYSMDGDICTLPKILEVSRRHGGGRSSTRRTPRSSSGPTAAGWRSTTGSTRRSTFTWARSRRARGRGWLRRVVAGT